MLNNSDECHCGSKSDTSYEGLLWFFHYSDKEKFISTPNCYFLEFNCKINFFSGEALEDEDYDEEDDEEEEDGEEGEEEEDDPDFDPSKAPKQQECKQQ